MVWIRSIFTLQISNTLRMLSLGYIFGPYFARLARNTAVSGRSYYQEFKRYDSISFKKNSNHMAIATFKRVCRQYSLRDQK